MTRTYEPQRQNHKLRVGASLAVVAALMAVGTLFSVLLLADDKGAPAPVNVGHVFVSTSPLNKASSTCGAGTLADDDHTLVLDMAGEEPGAGTLGMSDILCVLAELNAPQAVIARMEATRSMDGMQSTTWPDYEVTWTYHPDDGLDLIITNTA